jgi:ArsR family transcriptional regulator
MTTRTAKLKLETVFRALSDSTRLRILNLLRGGELCVCDLVAVLDLPQPTVSRHLSYLRRAGLVLARKEGLWHYYRLSPSAGAFHEKLLGCLAACEDIDPRLAADAKRLQSSRSRDCCE